MRKSPRHDQLDILYIYQSQPISRFDRLSGQVARNRIERDRQVLNLDMQIGRYIIALEQGMA